MVCRLAVREVPRPGPSGAGPGLRDVAVDGLVHHGVFGGAERGSRNQACPVVGGDGVMDTADRLGATPEATGPDGRDLSHGEGRYVVGRVERGALGAEGGPADAVDGIGDVVLLGGPVRSRGSTGRARVVGYELTGGGVLELVDPAPRADRRCLHRVVVVGVLQGLGFAVLAGVQTVHLSITGSYRGRATVQIQRIGYTTDGQVTARGRVKQIALCHHQGVGGVGSAAHELAGIGVGVSGTGGAGECQRHSGQAESDGGHSHCPPTGEYI